MCRLQPFVFFVRLKSAHLIIKMEEKNKMDKEAIIRYKFYLCRNFLDKLLSEGFITETQRRKIEKSVIKRLSEV